MTIAGVTPVGEMVDHYVVYEDGTAGHIRVNEGTEPTLARPGRFVSLEEYGERVAQLQDEAGAHVARLQAEDEARQRANFQALLAVGLPEANARDMSGFTGPLEERRD
jgi:hypothetical protein